MFTRELLILAFLIYPCHGWIYFPYISCNASNISVYSNYSCYLKKYGPQNNSLNVEVTLKVSIDDAGGQFKLEYGKKRDGPYTTLMQIAGNNTCWFVVNSNHPFMRWFFERAGPALQKQIHPCPYEGHVKFLEITPKDGHFSQWPAGFFKGSMKFSRRGGDDNVFQVTFLAESKYTKRKNG